MGASPCQKRNFDVAAPASGDEPRGEIPPDASPRPPTKTAGAMPEVQDWTGVGCPARSV